jgi:hypothetical protein
METCLVRLINDCTPTWRSRRVRANHTRHDPGRSVSHARATLVCPAIAAQMVAIAIAFQRSPKRHAHTTHTNRSLLSQGCIVLFESKIHTMVCRNCAAPELLCTRRCCSLTILTDSGLGSGRPNQKPKNKTLKSNTSTALVSITQTQRNTQLGGCYQLVT